MKTSLCQFVENTWTKHQKRQPSKEHKATRVLCFVSKEIREVDTIYSAIQSKFPAAPIALCSTSGKINQQRVLSDSLAAVAIKCEKTKIEATTANINHYNSDYTDGVRLFKKLPKENLVDIMVLSDCSQVNSSEQVKGLSTQTDKNSLVTRVLASASANFISKPRFAL